ncbi:MAG: RluA family pseudouridine synthase [Elusimicrobia bacterium]|nr:RluA family pseudouridine synthase [Elusimicrobiota bacterium]MDE2512132.1 RluA family pseudouridine synthase [Elusimicrobiota bacterium]
MIDSEILFEDERLLAAAKPAGRPTIPGRGDVGEAMNAELERRLGRKLLVVHRLDLESSGVVVFAKDAETHRVLCALFEGRSVRKVYAAAVSGALTGEGVISLPLKEFGSGRVAPSPDGKKSSTRWRVERTWKKATLLRVEPETGRRHQIRAHLCALGHPILGDPRYGPPPRPVGGAPRLMLHALELSFEAGGRPYAFRAEPPRDFAGVLAGL